MRFITTILLLVCLVLVTAPGCKSPSLQCRREIALLRAEILDVEDKYYALKSQHESMVGGQGQGQIVSNGIVGNGVIVGSQVIGAPVSNSYPVVNGGIVNGGIVNGGIVNGAVISDGQIIGGDIIYDDQMVPGSLPLMQQAPVENGAYYQGQPYQGQIYQGQPYPGQIYNGQMLETQVPPQNIQPTPAPAVNSESLDLNLSQPSIDDQTNSDQTMELPDLELEDFDDEIELGLGQEVDRIEITDSATRGKDLDGVAGDDGIELMVQTLAADGDFVDQRGEMTVTVNDQLVGEIGKWTFLADELKLFLSRDKSGKMGTLLHLPWTDRVPVSKQVDVRVSMVIGSIEYIASREIKIQPPTLQVNRDSVVGWTTKDTRWVNEAFSASPAQRGTNVGTRRNSVPAMLPSSQSTAVPRPKWKPVR